MSQSLCFKQVYTNLLLQNMVTKEMWNLEKQYSNLYCFYKFYPAPWGSPLKCCVLSGGGGGVSGKVSDRLGFKIRSNKIIE